MEVHRRGSVARRDLEALLPHAEVPALLRGALHRGLVTKQGQRGGTRYTLSDELVLRAGSRSIQARDRRRQSVLDEIRRRGEITTPDAATFLGESDRNTVRQILMELVHAGDVEAVGERRWRRSVLRR